MVYKEREKEITAPQLTAYLFTTTLFLHTKSNSY